MHKRVKITIKTFLKGMPVLVLMLLIFLRSALVHADTGELKINNQVIYEKNEGSQNHAATFTIPQLFMKDMSDQDQQIDEEKMNRMTSAKKAIFIQETPKQPRIEQQTTPILFAKEYILTDNLAANDSASDASSNLVVHLVLLFGGLLVTCLGVLLGRAFPKWLKKG